MWGDHEKTEPYRPQVAWNYIPEPATAMLLGLGALALIRRKQS
jgi:hypothetical protein